MPAAPALPSVEQVAHRISGYLLEHPSAADTAAGIQRWWIAPRHGELPLPLVEQALEALTQSGQVQRLGHPASQVVYGRGPALPPAASARY